MSKHNRPRARQLRTGIVLLLLLGAMCSCSGTPSRATTTAATVSDGARRDASTEGALTVDAHVALGEFVALVEQRLAGVAQSLKVLANVEQVQSGNWNAMQPPMRALAESGVAASAIWFARTDGSYLTLEQGAAAQTLSDRPYFDDLMTGKSIAGFLVVSRSTGKRSVVVAQPVVRAGRVVGAVGVSLSADELSRTLDEAMKLPQGVVFYALDAQGQTALHRDPNLMFAYPSDLGDATLRAAVREMLSTDKGVVRYEFRGVSKAVLHQRSPKLGWVFALGFPAGTAAR